VERAQPRQREEKVESLVGKAPAKRQALDREAKAGGRRAREVEASDGQGGEGAAGWGFLREGAFWVCRSVVELEDATRDQRCMQVMQPRTVYPKSPNRNPPASDARPLSSSSNRDPRSSRRSLDSFPSAPSPQTCTSVFLSSSSSSPPMSAAAASAASSTRRQSETSRRARRGRAERAARPGAPTSVAERLSSSRDAI
jgi:hypothetical protein